MAMGPRIDLELEEIDRRHASLTAANQQLVDALNYYQTLMKDYTSMPYTPYPVPDVMRYPPTVAEHQVLDPFTVFMFTSCIIFLLFKNITLSMRDVMLIQ